MKRFVISAAIVATCLTALAFSLHEALFNAGYDLFDRFRVIAALQEPGTNRFAVVHDYEHADSSAQVTAVWVRDGQRPPIDSIEPELGQPIMVWRGPISDVNINWADGKLVATPGKHLVAKPGDFGTCYFSGGPYFCFDASFVNLSPTTRQ